MSKPESDSQDGAPASAINHPPGYRGRRGQNWLGLGLMYASYYMCRYNLPIASVEMCKEFKLDNQAYGMINTGRDGLYAIGQFLNGLFTDKLGGKQAMAIGALLTATLNLAFGFASYAGIGSALVLFVMIRATDGYAQAFGAPGMVKTNTAWFRRQERGRFAGIFGMMIQLGVISINVLGPALLVGFTIPLLLLHVPALHWRWLFYVPAGIVTCVALLMWLTVKNNPEEIGYTIQHDEEAPDEDPHEKIPVREVFGVIVRKKAVWVCAGAYFCTGIVRTALNAWWVLYFYEVWNANIRDSTPEAHFVKLVGALMPLAATAGSLSSGFISDLLFRGKRAPVAMLIYTLETASILFAAVYLSVMQAGSLYLAGLLFLGIAVTCNSTHSIIGTAAAMDLGGRKMAGFAAGVIDSFQYLGAMLAGVVLGTLIDKFTWDVYFFFMLPFSALGTSLMAFMWWRTRGRDVMGG